MSEYGNYGIRGNLSDNLPTVTPSEQANAKLAARIAKLKEILKTAHPVLAASAIKKLTAVLEGQKGNALAEALGSILDTGEGLGVDHFLLLDNDLEKLQGENKPQTENINNPLVGRILNILGPAPSNSVEPSAQQDSNEGLIQKASPVIQKQIKANTYEPVIYIGAAPNLKGPDVSTAAVDADTRQAYRAKDEATILLGNSNNAVEPGVHPYTQWTIRGPKSLSRQQIKSELIAANKISWSNVGTNDLLVLNSTSKEIKVLGGKEASQYREQFDTISKRELKPGDVICGEQIPGVFMINDDGSSIMYMEQIPEIHWQGAKKPPITELKYSANNAQPKAQVKEAQIELMQIVQQGAEALASPSLGAIAKLAYNLFQSVSSNNDYSKAKQSLAFMNEKLA